MAPGHQGERQKEETMGKQEADAKKKCESERLFDQWQYDFLKACAKKGTEGIKEWNEWRKNHSKTPVSLERANLRGIYLQDADLRDAWLAGVDLTNADAAGTGSIGLICKTLYSRARASKEPCFLKENSILGLSHLGVRVNRVNNNIVMSSVRFWFAAQEAQTLVNGTIGESITQRSLSCWKVQKCQVFTWKVLCLILASLVISKVRSVCVMPT